MYNIYSSFIQGILLILIGVSCTLPLGSERTVTWSVAYSNTLIIKQYLCEKVTETYFLGSTMPL